MNNAPLSFEWVGWVILAIGGLLTISAITITQSSLSADSIWYVLLPGTAVGLLLMIVGFLTVRAAEKLAPSKGCRSRLR